MSALENYAGEETELVFGSRTIFAPGRSVEIGYSVRKKSPFPLVEELMLKLLNTVESASMQDIAGFVDLPAKDLLASFQPLLSRGLIIRIGDDFKLSEVGKMLFSRSDDDTPAISESEFRVNRFTIDDECALPTTVPDISEHIAKAKGALKGLIDDLRQSPAADESLLSKIRRNFGEYFPHFMRNEGDLDKIREEQLELHKTEYAKTQKSFAIRTDIQGAIRKNGVVVNRVLPFDSLTARPESRMAMRSALIEAAKTPVEAQTAGEIEFIRNCFGEDFLDGITTNGPLPWFKIMPTFFAGSRPKLQSGEQMVIGELCIPRNLLLIEDLIREVISEQEFSPEAPLRIAWVRPSVGSWGRSLAFLEGVKALRKIGEQLRKGSFVLELWENRFGLDDEIKPKLRSFVPWFDEVRYFRSPSIPIKMEMLLIGEHTGAAVTHAFTPLNACFPCPIGVAFSANDSVQELISEIIEPKLRSLPKP